MIARIEVLKHRLRALASDSQSVAVFRDSGRVTHARERDIPPAQRFEFGRRVVTTSFDSATAPRYYTAPRY